MDAAELNKKKVAELQQMLRERGLPTKGLKADLVQRLAAAGAQAAVSAVPAPAPAAAPPAQPAIAPAATPIAPVVQPTVAAPVAQSASAPTASTPPIPTPVLETPETGAGKAPTAPATETTTAPAVAAVAPVEAQTSGSVNGASSKPEEQPVPAKQPPQDEESQEAPAPKAGAAADQGPGEPKTSSEPAVGSKRTVSLSKDNEKQSGSQEKEAAANSKRAKLADGSAGKAFSNTESEGVTADSIAALAQEVGVSKDSDMKEAGNQARGAVRSRLGAAGGMSVPSPRGSGPGPSPRGLASSSPRAVVSPRTDGVRGRGANMFASVANSMADDEREPAPAQPATTVLKIEGLKRPFTEPQLRERLGEDGGIITWLWMNRIKSVCLVEFELKEQAETVRSSLYDERWPPKTGQKLVVSFVSKAEAEAMVEDAPNSVPLSNRLGAVANRLGHLSASQDRTRLQDRPSTFSPRDALSPRERERERERERKRERERGREDRPPPSKTLEDLFRKTTAKPEIFWLENTPAAKARKLGALRASAAPGGRGPPGPPPGGRGGDMVGGGRR